jgi:hypothetical protein
MKKLVFPVVLVILLALGLAISQEEAHEHGTHHDEHDRPEVLDKNIRLVFELADEDGTADKRVAITTAVPGYKLVARLGHDDEEAEILITGAAGPRNDGRILVLIEMEARFASPEGKTESAAECGVLLKAGSEREVAEWGDRTLILHADYAD